MADTTKIYPCLDYISNNLEFTLDREPDNSSAKSLLDEIKDQNPDEALVSTIALEKEINTFFRLQNPTVIAMLQAEFPDMSDNPDPQAVFLKLRELRNNW